MRIDIVNHIFIDSGGVVGGHLLVCSAGGHLKQLFQLASRMGIDPEDQHWVTYETGLSQRLLAGRQVDYCPYIGSRDLRGTWQSHRLAKRLMDEGDYSSVISTGASIAVAVLPFAARRGIPSHYIESAARADGPSLSGRMIAHDRKVHTYTQYPGWATDRWQYRGSIFDAYAPGPAREAGAVRRAVVTVGTGEGYSFRRLFERLVPLLDGVDVLWQVGNTQVADLGIKGHDRVPFDELDQAVAEADVVIAHSGTGSALSAMDNGKAPILVPRLRRHREHVDDHQVQIAGELQRRGLARLCHVEDLSPEVIARAAASSVVSVDDPPKIVLHGTARAAGAKWLAASAETGSVAPSEV